MPRRRCLGCRRLTANGSRCTACQSERNAAYNGEWRRIAANQLNASPQCAECGATTDLTVDHITPRSLTSGVQTLCRRCNGRKADH